MPGKYYEELQVGDVYRHPLRRTVTETDALLFTLLSMNPQPLHIDEEFAKTSIYGTRIVNSLFTLALVLGLSVDDLTSGTTLGNLGFSSIKFPAPVFIGDTIGSETTITARRLSSSRPGTGVVTFVHRGYKHDETTVLECERTGLMLQRGADGSGTDRSTK